MSVRKVKRGGEVHYQIDFRYLDAQGKKQRYRKDSHGRTKAEAEQEERRLVANCSLYGGPMAPATSLPSQATVGSIMDEYATHLITSVKPSTRRGYGQILKTIIIPRFSQMKLETLDYSSLVAVDKELIRHGCGPSRRRNVQVVFRNLLRWAVNAGRMEHLPKFPPLPQDRKGVPTCPTEEELRAVLAVARPSAKLAIALAAFAGLRAGEIRALRWDHVDLARNVINVRDNEVAGHTLTPKNGSERSVPIAAPLRSLLDGMSPIPGMRVALTLQGQPWGEYGLRQAWDRARRRAGIPAYKFHSLRSFFISSCFRAGGDARSIQVLAGHESLETTQRYAVSEEERRSAVVEALGNSWVTGPFGDGPDAA